jgi:excisionase family DNA binding protein
MVDIVEIAGHEYISAEALSKKFGVHRTTIQRWAKERGLPVVKIGHTCIFEMKKLVAWLDRKED